MSSESPDLPVLVDRVLDMAARSMATGMVIVEAPTGRILFMNDEVQRVFGRASHPVFSKDDYDAVLAYDASGALITKERWPIARALAGETVNGEQVEVHRHDGTRATISINASP